MGAEAAVNAVYANKIAALRRRGARRRTSSAKREEYEKDIDIVHLASELVVDAIVEPEDLRDELIARFAASRTRTAPSPRRHGVTPV